MDYEKLKLSDFESILLKARKRLVRSMHQVDKTLDMLSNGHAKPNGRVKIHSIEVVKKAKAGKKSGTRVLQGRYLGAVRWLTAKQRAEVKKVKEEKGYTQALRLAKSYKKESASA